MRVLGKVRLVLLMSFGLLTACAMPEMRQERIELPTPEMPKVEEVSPEPVIPEPKIARTKPIILDREEFKAVPLIPDMQEPVAPEAAWKVPHDMPPLPAVAALLKQADQQMEAKQWSQSVVTLERAIRVDSRYAATWTRLAMVRIGLEQFTQAEDLLHRSNNLAQSQNQLRAFNWRLIAQVREAMGQGEGAQEALRRAATLSGY